MAAKRLTLAKKVDKAATLLQKLVRLKAADYRGMVTCVTCGHEARWNDGIQGGHYISRTYLSTKLLEKNVHPQCQRCNGFKGGNMSSYALFMLDMYGADFLQELEILKNTPKKYTHDEIDNIIRDLTEQVKALEKEKGFCLDDLIDSVLMSSALVLSGYLIYIRYFGA